ncbi:glycosyltransferase family 4 protein [Flavobacterium sp. YO64]|uniref:glycosyltransferase family 4 protein n=1 Tax=Flavobacterium sp. YO64 TaxID=394559 RepID=UPI00100A4492|nr:glycosyltransferase family 4 protein [Flavobacterium sp. YO64]RXM43987.1 glycosyl transferase [Flavobacterium sp. YO64]
MKDNICCIFNLAPHYNEPIYKLMDSELQCDFYIGDRVSYPIKLMNYFNLTGYKKTLKYTPIIKKFYWQKGAFSLAFKNYKHYIITGEPHCLSTWLVLLMNRLTGRKTYLWTHGWYGNESSLKKIIKKVFFGLSNKVLLYGDYSRNLMINEGFNPEKLVSVYNSMDVDNQLNIRKELISSAIYKNHFLNDYPVLLYVGRIQNRKKIELLIEALHELEKSNCHYNLILIGNQIEGIGLEELVNLYKLEKKVWFFGPCYDENILGELIFNADLCVVPGDIGLTVMHSFVYGTPVVTHNNFPKHGPEFEAIRPNITGDFFAEGSVNDLCSKIKQWTIFRKEDRETVRAKCYKVVDEKYNSNHQINILKEIFKLKETKYV